MTIATIGKNKQITIARQITITIQETTINVDVDVRCPDLVPLLPWSPLKGLCGGPLRPEASFMRRTPSTWRTGTLLRFALAQGSLTGDPAVIPSGARSRACHLVWRGSYLLGEVRKVSSWPSSTSLGRGEAPQPRLWHPPPRRQHSSINNLGRVAPVYRSVFSSCCNFPIEFFPVFLRYFIMVLFRFFGWCKGTELVLAVVYLFSGKFLMSSARLSADRPTEILLDKLTGRR